MADSIKAHIQNWSDRNERKLQSFEREADKRYEVVKETAEMLDRPVGQILGITKGWSAEKLEKRLLRAQKEENPQKYWWGKRKAE